MNLYASALSLCIILATLPSKSARAGDLLSEAVEYLHSDNYSDRLKGVGSLDQFRSKLIGSLIAVFAESSSVEAKEAAARVLGSYRAVEAVDVLVQNLALDSRPRIMKGLLTEEEVRPISTALINIGTPAVSKVIARIKQTDDPALLESLTGICVAIEGRETIKCVLLNHLDHKESAIVGKRLLQAYAIIIQSETNVMPTSQTQ